MGNALTLVVLKKFFVFGAGSFKMGLYCPIIWRGEVKYILVKEIRPDRMVLNWKK